MTDVFPSKSSSKQASAVIPLSQKLMHTSEYILSLCVNLIVCEVVLFAHGVCVCELVIHELMVAT